MNKFLILISFCLLLVVSLGQNSPKLDSLLNVFQNEKDDTLKIKSMNHIVDEYMMLDLSKALNYAQQQLILAEKVRWKKGIGYAYYNLGNANNGLGNYSLALHFWQKNLQINRELNNIPRICLCYINIGGVYQDLGDFKKSLENELLALEMAEKMKSYERTSLSLCNIGLIHVQLGNNDKGLEYLYKSLVAAEKIDLKGQIAIDYGDIGTIYVAKKDYNKGVMYYLRALKIDEQAGNKRNVAGWLANIGEAYYYKGDSAKEAGNQKLLKEFDLKTIAYYLQSLKLLTELGDKGLQATILGDMGSIYTKRMKYDEAEKYLQKAFAVSTEINFTDEIMNDHKYFYDFYKAKNMPSEALKHYEIYLSIKDSLENVSNKKTVSEFQIKYDTDKKEAENQRLLQQNKIQALSISNNEYLISGFIGLFILVIAFGFLIFRQNKLRSQQSAVQFEQKLLRTQMNPHFIFNSLAGIESFIYDHQPKEAGVYLSNFSRLMRLILENSASEYIPLNKEIEILNYYFSLQKMRLDDELSYVIEVDKQIDQEQLFLPPMLLQPFIENAIEHGFRGSSIVGEIKVMFHLIENNLQVEISDNGIGIEKAQNQKDLHKDHKSMAIQITMERLKYLNRSKKRKFSFTITDLGDKQTGKTGTRIIFSIPF